MRLVSWNTNARTGRIEDQAKALRGTEPDLVALQEVREEGLASWQAELNAIGLIQRADTRARRGERKNSVMLASRWPLRELEPAELPQPERFLSVVVEHPGGEFELHTAHLPPGSQYGLVKVQTFVGIYAALADNSTRPRILCGDFNSPRAETSAGETITFGAKHPRHQALWAAAEQSVLRGLARFDLPDVYRQLNGWDLQEVSWIPSRGEGRRFDHVFASKSLNAVSCDYIHAWREKGLSDHSAIEAEFGHG